MDYYFSEKLIDAISVGCIPIYWGCPSIWLKFQVTPFENFVELQSWLMNLSIPAYSITYKNRTEEIGLNLETAKQYRMPEDWMFAEYPELFI